MENRERLGSRLGFIMLSAGCAIGCGNVWKFPWMCGQNGGGSFLLIYVICLIVLGLPTMIMEFSVGACGADESTLYVSEIIRRQGQMESVGHRLSHRKHCADRFLCGGVRMDPLLFCKISDRAESGFRI